MGEARYLENNSAAGAATRGSPRGGRQLGDGALSKGRGDGVPPRAAGRWWGDMRRHRQAGLRAGGGAAGSTPERAGAEEDAACSHRARGRGQAGSTWRRAPSREPAGSAPGRSRGGGASPWPWPPRPPPRQAAGMRGIRVRRGPAGHPPPGAAPPHSRDALWRPGSRRPAAEGGGVSTAAWAPDQLHQRAPPPRTEALARERC